MGPTAANGVTNTKTLRAFLAGAGCGFLIGAFVAALVAWQYGSVIRSRVSQLPAKLPSAEEPGNEAPSSTRGSSRPAPAPAGSPDASAETFAAGPLAERDLLIPVEGVSREELVRTFGHTRGEQQHEALDIPAPRNTPVRAVESGRIARLFYSEAGGITIYQFDPTEEYCYYYAHLERYANGLAEGQTVHKGQVIGYVGVSGNAPKDTPHLHFAIFRLTDAKRWWEGTPIDPFDVLR